MGTKSGKQTSSRIPANQSSDEEPIVVVTKNEDGSDIEVKEDRVTLFTIDGTDYTIPAVVTAADALKVVEAMTVLPKSGWTVMALQTALGMDGYRAFLNAGKYFTNDQVRSLINRVTKLYTDGITDLAKN